MAAAVAHFLHPNTRILYLKMDSTLRGNWARETACALRAAAAIRGQQPLAILAPAFPAAGRTMVGGLGLLNGVALKETETWRHAGLTRPTEPAAWLATEGLRVTLAGIDEVRLGPCRLAASFAERSAAGADAVLCDAQSEADLDAIAGAALALAPKPLCVGSAGLMRALAAAGGRRPASPALPLPVTAAGPVLIVVGSASEVSRGQVQALVEEGRCLRSWSRPQRFVGEWRRAGFSLMPNGSTPRWSQARTSPYQLLGARGWIFGRVGRSRHLWPTLLRRGCTASVASLPPAARPPGLSSPAPAHQA